MIEFIKCLLRKESFWRGWETGILVSLALGLGMVLAKLNEIISLLEGLR